MIRQIFLKLHSDEYAENVLSQVEHDGAGTEGFGGCSVALFGQLGSGKFEFVLTGRHVTRRCDGDTVKLTGAITGLTGLPISELTKDQQGLARKVMADLLAPFREIDRTECMKLIETSGFDKLHLSYYKNENIGDDEIWDVWQIEGPSTIWYFRGKPHVHAWVHIRNSA